MEFKFKKSQDKLTVFLFGELDEYSSSSAREVIDRVLMDNLNFKKIVFDLSGLTFMDSTGIGFLIGRYKKFLRFGVKSYIINPSQSTDKILSMSGVYTLIPKL